MMKLKADKCVYLDVKFPEHLMYLLTLIALTTPALTGEVQAKTAVGTTATRLQGVATVSAPAGYNKSKHVETSVNFIDAACLAASMNIPAPNHAANPNSNTLVFLPIPLLKGILRSPGRDFATSWNSEIYAYRFAISFPHHHFW
jgi:hypothetical protein